MLAIVMPFYQLTVSKLSYDRTFFFFMILTLHFVYIREHYCAVQQ